jgi:hypothetical protein
MINSPFSFIGITLRTAPVLSAFAKVQCCVVLCADTKFQNQLFKIEAKPFISVYSVCCPDVKIPHEQIWH